MRFHVVKRDAESKRVTACSDDGVFIEFSPNPKTNTPPAWFARLHVTDKIHVALHDMDGGKITPGSGCGVRPRVDVWLFPPLALLGVFVGWIFASRWDQLYAALRAFFN